MVIYQEKIAPPDPFPVLTHDEPATALLYRRTIFYSLRLEDAWLKAQFARLAKWK